MKTSERLERATSASVVPSVGGAIEPAVYVKDLDVPMVALPSASPAAEQRYRLAAVRLEAALESRRTVRTLGRLVLVTSPESGDGRTTTALHLSIALARSLGRRVALVELDRARPGLTAMLGVPPVRGLADVLGGAATLDDILLRGDDGGPMIVPGGEPNGHTFSAAALLAPLNALREYYDYVVADCSALDRSADAAVLGRAADGVLLVVRAGATRGPALAGAMEALADAPLLGCVLNDLDGRPGQHAATPKIVRVSRPLTDEDD